MAPLWAFGGAAGVVTRIWASKSPWGPFGSVFDPFWRFVEAAMKPATLILAGIDARALVKRAIARGLVRPADPTEAELYRRRKHAEEVARWRARKGKP